MRHCGPHPQAVGALLRYFRDLDQAEEAFQEACLRALRNWPVNGPPRDGSARRKNPGTFSSVVSELPWGLRP
jgi:predicted RNA polymerase sigma factor